MEGHIYSDPAHNLGCDFRFTCGAARCPETIPSSRPPSCHVDKFRRYQPDNNQVWYRRDWQEVNRITWRDVFSLQESWIYALLLIIITAFVFMSMILIKLLLKVNQYH